MSDVDKKIKKLCKQIEGEIGEKVEYGKAIQGKEKTTIPISVKKISQKGEQITVYKKPIGLIEISGQDIKFVPEAQELSLFKTILKVIIVIISILGITKYLKSEKKWNED
jgi:hypothetical protein